MNSSTSTMMSTDTTEFTTLESAPKPNSDMKSRLEPAQDINVSSEKEKPSLLSNLMNLSDVDQVQGYNS